MLKKMKRKRNPLKSRSKLRNKLRNKKERKVRSKKRKKRKNNKSKNNLNRRSSRWKPDSTTESSIWEQLPSTLSSDFNQESVKYLESSFWKKISLKSTLQNLSAVRQKVEPTFSNWVTSERKLASLNLPNFTSKCASWETSKESSKSVQSSELRTHSLTDTCASS